MTDQGLPSASAAGSSSEDDIDISTPAVVIWGSSNHLADVTFDIRRDAATKSAFFKLRATVLFKALAPSKTGLFLLVHPQRIQSLDFVETSVEETTLLEVTRKKLGSNVTCLRFVLPRPADLVGPKIHSLTAKNRASGDVLDSMRSLARQVSFAVYIPQKVLSKARLLSLCEATTRNALGSIAHQADITRLYKGQGGQVINDGVAHENNETPHASSPPSYDEIGPSPPPGLPASAGDMVSKKRRRSDSDDAASRPPDSLFIESMCRKIVEEQKAEMLKALHDHEARLYDRLLADLKPYVSNELQSLETRILEQVDQRIGKQAEEQQNQVDQQLQDLQDDVNDAIDSKLEEVDGQVEDELYGLRLRLEDFVKDEITDAEERIIEHLESSASISLQFNT